jgi:ribosomal protein S1
MQPLSANYLLSVGDVISGMVEQGRDGKMIYVNLGKTEGKVPPQEQVPGEHFEHGDRIKCFVVDVKQGTRGPEITLSRSHPGFSKAVIRARSSGKSKIALLKLWALLAKQVIAPRSQFVHIVLGSRQRVR